MYAKQLNTNPNCYDDQIRTIVSKQIESRLQKEAEKQKLLEEKALLEKKKSPRTRWKAAFDSLKKSPTTPLKEERESLTSRRLSAPVKSLANWELFTYNVSKFLTKNYFIR